ncbi:MAG TPA: ArsR family transcriptional regulator [Candidatus Sulfomarinibacteraceae bacterium]|nr:ArsR family transcriptional regulator [Candidatus Sulfomarinibacteraceae bacterium]
MSDPGPHADAPARADLSARAGLAKRPGAAARVDGEAHAEPPAPESVAVSTLGRALGNGAAQSLSPSSLRRAILVNLRQRGPMSPDGLAGHLGASRTGVLQQLHALEQAGLVAHSTERHGVGRPRHLYDVTPDAQDLFPADYDGFAAALLEAISAVGGDQLVEEVFAARRRQLGARLRQKLRERVAPGASLLEQVRALAVIQDGAGYLAEAILGADGTIRLREHNCAIFHLAREAGSCCEAELAMFGEVLGADVVRETHIASGERSCTYRVEPRAGD